MPDNDLRSEELWERLESSGKLDEILRERIKDRGIDDIKVTLKSNDNKNLTQDDVKRINDSLLKSVDGLLIR